MIGCFSWVALVFGLIGMLIGMQEAGPGQSIFSSFFGFIGAFLFVVGLFGLGINWLIQHAEKGAQKQHEQELQAEADEKKRREDEIVKKYLDKSN